MPFLPNNTIAKWKKLQIDLKKASDSEFHNHTTDVSNIRVDASKFEHIWLKINHDVLKLVTNVLTESQINQNQHNFV